MWTLSLGVPIGCRSPRKRGPYSTPVHMPPASGCDASIAKARKTIANSAGPDIFQPKRFDTAKTHLRHRTRCTKATRAEMAFRVETRGSSPDLRLVVQNDVQQ